MKLAGDEPEIRYKHVEAVLKRIFKVSSDTEGAFRARLRHLRNMGIPDLPKPGSGAQIPYTRVHLIQMIIALELSALGIAPRHAADLAERIGPPESPQSQEEPERDAIHRLYTPGRIIEFKGRDYYYIPPDRDHVRRRFGGKGQTFLTVYPGSRSADAGNYNVEVKELNRLEIATEVMSNPRISFVNLTPSIQVLDEFLNSLS